MELLRKLFGMRSQSAECDLPSEWAFKLKKAHAPSMQNEYSHVREQRIQEWTQEFLAYYRSASSSEQHASLEQLLTLNGMHLFHVLEALSLLGEMSFAEFLGGYIATHFEPKNDALFSSVRSSNLPEKIKKCFVSAREEHIHLKKIDDDGTRNATLKISLEKLLLLPSSEDNKLSILEVLHRMRVGKTPLPKASNFTSQVMQKYPDSKRIGKSIRELHKAHPDWSKHQTYIPRGGKRS